MGVRILNDSDGAMAALYCSTSDVAFGPVFQQSDDVDVVYHDAVERAESFLRFLPQDARKYSDDALQSLYSEWLGQEKAQWAREQAEEDARTGWTDEEAAK